MLKPGMNTPNLSLHNSVSHRQRDRALAKTHQTLARKRAG
jgi:hypothetical protein